MAEKQFALEAQDGRIGDDARTRAMVAALERTLARVRISSVTMVTRRSIGFGGTMMAVPVIAPEWEWITGPGDRPVPAPQA